MGRLLLKWGNTGTRTRERNRVVANAINAITLENLNDSSDDKEEIFL
jgi:hypothetical protein